MIDEAEDTGLLDGRVHCFQPRAGFRSAIDPVLLAAAVPADSGDVILDVGAGTGAASLCLAARVADCQVIGLEKQDDLCVLAQRGASASGVSDRVRFFGGDLLDPPAPLEPGSFDHVMANPPYRARDTGNRPPDPGRAAATIEGAAALNDWLTFCIRMVRDGGTITFVHHFDRRDEVVSGLRYGAGSIVVCPLWPKHAGVGAKRVIVSARRGGRETVTMASGVVLHAANGGYTEEAEAILRQAQPLISSVREAKA